MSLLAHFESLSDAELILRIQSGGLTEDAQQIALAEARTRGLHAEPPSEEAGVEPDDAAQEGEMVMLERGLSPQEAQILSGFLASAGINADAGDTNIVQANALLTIAVGGASLRVPASRLQEARDLLAAFRRGEFAIDDDFESGETAA